MSIFLLALTLTGFARTFFLRWLFQVPAIAPHIYVHALLMTGWFTLLVVQTSLVAAHRTDLHRRLGVLGAVLAVAVAGVALLTELGLPAHFRVDPSLDGIPIASLEDLTRTFWGDLGTIGLFAVLVTVALWSRRRPETHKRLLLLASLAAVAPAYGRYIAYLNMWRGASSVPLVPVALLMLFVAVVIAMPFTLAIHDLRRTRRLHPATVWGILGSLVVGIGSHFVLPATTFGRAVVIALEHR
jgi:hypothetical protein